MTAQKKSQSIFGKTNQRKEMSLESADAFVKAGKSDEKVQKKQKPLQVYFDEDMLVDLAVISAKSGKTRADIIRNLVAQYIEENR